MMVQGHRIQAYPVLLRSQATVFESIKRIMKKVSKVRDSLRVRTRTADCCEIVETFCR